MKTKLVLWATNEEDKKVLVALELKPKENKVLTWLFYDASDEFGRDMMHDWREDKEVILPENHEHSEQSLTAVQSLLPDNIKADRPDLVVRAQTEWHFLVLSARMNQAYHDELQDFKDKIETLVNYDQALWDQLKGFWDKVNEQFRERNLSRSHAMNIKESVNELFSRMKELRASLDSELEARSKDTYNYFSSRISEIQTRLEGKSNLRLLFEELKKLQQEVKKAEMVRSMQNQIWDQIDKAFKIVKERRFGSKEEGNSALQRLRLRYDGLMKAIKKMSDSIERDKDDLHYQHKKIGSSATGQLESQIREAKVKMIEERIRSKQEKLDEMTATQKELEGKIATQEARDAKKKEESEKIKENLAKAKALKKEQEAAPEKVSPKAKKKKDGPDALEKPKPETVEVPAEKAAVPVAEKKEAAPVVEEKVVKVVVEEVKEEKLEGEEE